MSVKKMNSPPREYHVALHFAQVTHKGQMDDGGNPYMQHVAMVVNGVAHLNNPFITVVAVLHDVLEKHPCPSAVARSINKTLPPEVLENVGILTRMPGQRYDDHIMKVIDAGRPAIAVKLAELHDNMRTSRLCNTVFKVEQDRLDLYATWYTHLRGVWLSMYNEPFDGLLALDLQQTDLTFV